MEKNEIQVAVAGIIILLIFIVMFHSIETNNTVTAMWEDSQPTTQPVEPEKVRQHAIKCVNYDGSDVVVYFLSPGRNYDSSFTSCLVDLTPEAKQREEIKRIIEWQMNEINKSTKSKEVK